MDSDELVVLQRCADGMEAEFIASCLEENGIEASVINAHQPINLSMDGMSVTGNTGVLVRQGDLDLAREIIGKILDAGQEDSEESGDEPGDRYYGVKGWLMFFCFSMAGLSPLFNARYALAIWQELSPYMGYSTSFRVFFIIEIILRVFFILFSITAGVMLWQKVPNAVRTAKTYLVGFFLFLIYLNFLSPYLMYGDWGTVTDTSSIMALFPLIQGSLYAAFWYIFLCKSKRVASTYGGS